MRLMGFIAFRDPNNFDGFKSLKIQSFWASETLSGKHQGGSADVAKLQSTIAKESQHLKLGKLKGLIYRGSTQTPNFYEGVTIRFA